MTPGESEDTWHGYDFVSPKLFCEKGPRARINHPINQGGVMNRRRFIQTAAGGLATLGFGNWANADPFEHNHRPNIIVIMADDMGWGDLSCYPQDPRFPDARLRTPNIDSLASQGVRCTQGYATCCVCAPHTRGIAHRTLSAKVWVLCLRRMPGGHSSR